MIDTLRICCVLACLWFATGIASADEVILDEKKYDDVFVGDFNCSSCRHQLGPMAFKLAPGMNELTAGELWSHFKSHGIDSMDEIVICMDIIPGTQLPDVGVQRMEFAIKDPFNRVTLTNYSLDRDGDNSLIIPAYEASSFRPEAKMKINLGFDFMQRFSKDSPETITFNVEVDKAEGVNPSFFIAADDSYVSLPNVFTLGLFVTFWIVVFLILFRLTHPAKADKQQPLST